MVPAELDKAGIKADGGFVVWGGVPSGEEGGGPYRFQVSDAEALIKTICVGETEAALQMEAPARVSEGLGTACIGPSEREPKAAYCFGRVPRCIS